MTDRIRITELDLLAYADGLLDPARAAEVELWLQAHPEEADRIADYQAQNRAIRAAYGAVAGEPLPGRLLDVLDTRPKPSRVRLMRAAAMAASLVAAAMLGWWVGQDEAPNRVAEPQPEGLIEASLALHEEISQPVSASGNGGALLVGEAKASEPSERITLELAAPDLSTLGFTLKSQRPTDLLDRDGVQLVYVDGAGRSLSLFLRTRAQTFAPNPSVLPRQAGFGLAYWADGPFSIAVAGPDGAGLREVTDAVHRSLRSGQLRFGPSQTVAPALASEEAVLDTGLPQPTNP